MASYAEEKSSLIDVDTFNVITLDQYCRLRELGAPQAIPSMCILVIKTDENGRPDPAKSRIVSWAILRHVRGANMNERPLY